MVKRARMSRDIQLFFNYKSHTIVGRNAIFELKDEMVRLSRKNLILKNIVSRSDFELYIREMDWMNEPERLMIRDHFYKLWFL